MDSLRESIESDTLFSFWLSKIVFEQLFPNCMLYYEYQAEVLKMTVKRFKEQEKLEENCEPKTMDVEEYCLCSLHRGVLLFA